MKKRIITKADFVDMIKMSAFTIYVMLIFVSMSFFAGIGVWACRVLFNYGYNLF